jgi:hypothetical protein
LRGLMDEPTKLAVSFASSVIVAVIVAIITVRLSLQRFRSERWWEKKVDAYIEIMDALYLIHDFYSRHLMQVDMGYEISDEARAELHRQSQAAEDEVSRSIVVGELLISRQAVHVLSDVSARRESIGVDREMTVSEIYAQNQFLVEECINQLRALAKQDLGVEKTSKMFAVFKQVTD